MPTLPGTHRPNHLPSRRTEVRALDRSRGSASERGYDHRWAKASKGHLRHHPLCVGCAAVGRVEAAVLTDHAEPHKGDTRKFWDKTNWQSSCQWHHDVVKQKLERLWLQGKLEVTELRLDSDAAKQLTRSLRG